MKVLLNASKQPAVPTTLAITGSKSETNRLLLLQALYPNLKIKNTSASDDSKVLTKALTIKSGTVDVHHAGTAMRFLTAYFTALPGSEVVLTGSERMQQRPIGVLVDALRKLGGSISYVKKEGYPPLKISGKNLQKNVTTLRADVSSQFISALLLMAPALPNGLSLSLLGTITSKPYLDMTLDLLAALDVAYRFEGNSITISHKPTIQDTTIVVESDWSSASYFYSAVALSDSLEITLTSYKAESLQGDGALNKLYKSLGVSTRFNSENESITLFKNNSVVATTYKADLSNTPDIAQTIAVTCFGLGIGCHLTGLHTLKIKETDRLLALQLELRKLGATVDISEDSIQLEATSAILSDVAIKTYNDHRMAMAFAPLAFKTSLTILDAEVVSKSFPTFWEDLQKVGISVQKEA
ncbi:3-phosphoshikimate 1-carboxyvinyltransferase [Rasiella rasia]|uniref:3-phosphoshikimate 1-carboxyvinyltransferase n=1 Tax=Rasiella rasia TaxID=2744027 RepID=A0A6G6GPL7_9FLAO|nr:3-phosphoshikimate 1-carboxyvinyltransferase [Rasiella rasia]QIE60373.1 3-phosphoshikimate 1-carboxyvinyltransferase [Rasiella rasia]